MNVSFYARPVMNHQVENTAPGIALVAHDACKQEMIEWARFYRETLSSHMLYTTGTTGSLLACELDLRVHRLLSGPYGGDAQIGASVAERRVRSVIFFWDPLTPQPHDVDVKTTNVAIRQPCTNVGERYCPLNFMKQRGTHETRRIASHHVAD